jgi:hypothetical protein
MYDMQESNPCPGRVEVPSRLNPVRHRVGDIHDVHRNVTSYDQEALSRSTICRFENVSVIRHEEAASCPDQCRHIHAFPSGRMTVFARAQRKVETDPAISKALRVNRGSIHESRRFLPGIRVIPLAARRVGTCRDLGEGQQADPLIHL